jgi:hypothetical protein
MQLVVLSLCEVVKVVRAVVLVVKLSFKAVLEMMLEQTAVVLLLLVVPVPIATLLVEQLVVLPSYQVVSVAKTVLTTLVDRLVLGVVLPVIVVMVVLSSLQVVKQILTLLHMTVVILQYNRAEPLLVYQELTQVIFLLLVGMLQLVRR